MTLTTPASSGWRLRATIVCSALMACAANSIGSLPVFGIAACAPLPVATISKMSNAPISGPTRVAIVPSGHQRPVVHAVDGAHREALEEPFLDHHPAAAFVLLGRLEDEVRRCRRSRAFARAPRAAPSSIAVWPSWPHACILPSTFDACAHAGFLVDVQRVEVGAQADRVVAGSALRARRRRRSSRVRCARRARTSAACRRRTRSSPSPRRRSPGARGCGAASVAMSGTSAATSGTTFMGAPWRPDRRSGILAQRAPAESDPASPALELRRSPRTLPADAIPSAGVRPARHRRRHQRRRHRARRRGARPQGAAGRAGRHRVGHVAVEHEADPRRPALPRALRVPAGAESLAEREVLLRQAPHIVEPLSFVLPHEPHLRPAWMLRAGLFLYDHLGGARRCRARSASTCRARRWGAGLKPKFGKGFVYSDARVDDARLVVFNVHGCGAPRGATIRVRTTLVSARRERDAAGPSGARRSRDGAGATTEVTAQGARQCRRAVGQATCATRSTARRRKRASATSRAATSSCRACTKARTRTSCRTPTSGSCSSFRTRSATR